MMLPLPAFVSLLDTTTNKCWEVTREYDGKKNHGHSTVQVIIMMYGALNT